MTTKPLAEEWREFAKPTRRIQLSCHNCNEQHAKIPFNCSCECHTLEYLKMIIKDLEKLFDSDKELNSVVDSIENGSSTLKEGMWKIILLLRLKILGEVKNK